MKKLSTDQLYKKCDLDDLNTSFTTTSDIAPLQDELLNQEKAREVLNFGLSMDYYGYNIFLSGEPSSRRKTYLKKVLSEKSKSKDVPNDLCYVHNFKEERKPILISLSPGTGYSFKQDMQDFIDRIRNEFEILFNDRIYKKERELIEQKYDELAEKSFLSYSKESRTKYKHTLDFGTDSQIYYAPLNKSGEVLKQEQFDTLPEKAKKFYKDMKNKVGILVIELLHEQDDIESKRVSELKEYDKIAASRKIDELMENLTSTYIPENPKIELYLNDLKKDLLENMDSLKSKESSDSSSPLDLFSGGLSSSSFDENNNSFTKKYVVNLIVDNRELENAPIIFVKNPYDNTDLFGTTAIFVDSKGMMTTDFTQIRAGEILKANGGFLVLDAEYLCDELWHDLKTVLLNQKLEISSQYYKTDIVLADALAPEAVDINLKVILLGSSSIYQMLYSYDNDFRELFEIHSSFDYEMRRTQQNEENYLRFVSKYCYESSIKPLSKNAVERIIEHSSRVAEHQDKIALSYKSLYNILNESNLWASKLNKDIIDLEVVEKTLDYKYYMKDNYSKYNNVLLKEKVLLIDVECEKIGQINGLCILGLEDCSIGEPTKITASTYIGKSKIISIEKDTDMSGPTHNKGVNILSGYLNSKLSDSVPIPLTTSLAFEQNYTGIDGDSATLAEVCVILSSMSDIPVKQSIAITGSMNQKGDVQAIGGVNEKIEGFFDACKILESSVINGVIIPESNVQNLMLRKDVVDSVKKGNFEIYSVVSVEEAVELLLGKPFGEIIDLIKNKYCN